MKGGNCCHDREEVKGVVSNCPQDQTESPESGMSGALEVLSRKAVELYGDRSQLCSANGYGDVGEEFFMQACMQMLQAKSIQGANHAGCQTKSCLCVCVCVKARPANQRAECRRCQHTARRAQRVRCSSLLSSSCSSTPRGSHGACDEYSSGPLLVVGGCIFLRSSRE